MIGVGYSGYVSYETMRLYPGPETRRRICDFYGLDQREVFPEELRGTGYGKFITEGTIDRQELLSLGEASHRNLLPLVTIGEEVEEGELKDALENSLNTLKLRNAKILRLYYGLGGQESMTLDEIGAMMGISKQRVRQLREDGLSELRKHSRKDYGLYYQGLGAYLENL